MTPSWIVRLPDWVWAPIAPHAETPATYALVLSMIVGLVALLLVYPEDPR